MTHCVRNLICDSPITKAISEELIFGTKFVEVVCLVREVKMNFSYHGQDARLSRGVGARIGQNDAEVLLSSPPTSVQTIVLVKSP